VLPGVRREAVTAGATRGAVVIVIIVVVVVVIVIVVVAVPVAPRAPVSGGGTEDPFALASDADGQQGDQDRYQERNRHPAHLEPPVTRRVDSTNIVYMGAHRLAPLR
jgi:hypothetical protein